MVGRNVQYYRLLADPNLTERWFPGGPLREDAAEIDARDFIEGKPYAGLQPTRLLLDLDGPRPEFTFAAFDMPIVSNQLADTLSALCPNEIQRFPIAVGDTLVGYEILNVVVTVPCLDEEQSHVLRWSARDGREDKIGQIRRVGSIKITTARAQDHDIFRISGWEIALIVSERVKKCWHRFSNLGVAYVPVT